MAQKLTQAEKDEITVASAKAFQLANQDYYGCPANSAKLLGFIEEQLGAAHLKEYPLQTEHFQAAWQHLNDMGAIFIQRPESQESIDARKRQAQAQADANDRLIQHAAEVGEWVKEQTQVLREMPIRDLRTAAVQQRNGVKSGEIERTTYRNNPSSRVIEVSDRAAARTRVAARFPLMNRESAEFSKLVFEEMQQS